MQKVKNFVIIFYVDTLVQSEIRSTHYDADDINVKYNIISVNKLEKKNTKSSKSCRQIHD